jgi:CHASE2 domain-containing sensor protein
VVAYVCLFVNAALNRSAVPFALIALGVTVLGLSAVNVSAALAAVLDGRSTHVYWLQTGLIAAYLVWLLLLHLNTNRRQSDRSGDVPGHAE